MTSDPVVSATPYIHPLRVGYTAGRARSNRPPTSAVRPIEAYASPTPLVWLVRETVPSYGADVACRQQPDDSEAITSLGEQIMTLAEHLHAETHRWLMLIAEFDRRRGWELYGFGSCAEWLAYSTRLDKVTAREKVRVARALAGLPETSAAMARGELSFSQVRAITRVADDENEAELLEHARSTSASGLERLVRSWRRLDREDEAALEARRHAMRRLSVFPDDHGMYLVRGTLDPEVGALLMRAIEAASDALYQGSVPETTPEQRRADALGLLAERALAAGFMRADDRSGGDALQRTDELAVSGTDARDRASAESSAELRASPALENGASAESAAPDHLLHGSSPVPARSDTAETDTSAETGAGGAPSAPSVGWRSERYLVVLHVDPATVTLGKEPGRSELEDGTRVSAESARRLACDAGIVRVTRGGNESDAAVEGKARTVPLRLRRALEIRDRGCRFPGCGSRYTDAHHIRHWADGGATRLDNLILLCRTHHRLLHEGGFRLQPNPDRPVRPTFISPRGVPIPAVPPKMTLNGRAIGAAARTGRLDPPEWERDVPLALYWRTLESLG